MSTSTTQPTDWSQSFFRGPADHGVRAFDGDLGHATPTGHGRIEIRRTPEGRYYALVELDTALGHLCAAVHLEGSSGRALVTAGATDAPQALAPLDALSDKLADIAARLTAAATAGQVGAELLKAAMLVVRAHAGDDRARQLIRKIRASAAAGNAGGVRRVAVLRRARDWARSVLNDRTVTGDIFGSIGNAISSAAKSIGNDVSQAAKEVGSTVSSIGHAIQPALNSIKQWGPAILSDIQGIVSLIPGIGTGISAAISVGIALLDGDSPLEVAIEAAYGAIPIPPGIRPITDTVLDTVLALIKNPHNLLGDALTVARDRIPSGLPQQVFDTLVRLIAHAAGGGSKSAPKAATHAAGSMWGSEEIRHASARYYIARYTQGHGPALQRGLPRLSPDVQAYLADLPDPHTAFQSIHQIAPHFTVDPALAGPLVAYAHRMGQHRHGIPPAPAAVQAQQTAAVATAVTAHAHHAAQLRIAQQNFEAPRRNTTPAPASIAVDVSADGSQQRVVASPSLSHLASAVAT